ncbi:hypothetical protein B0O80DRAFT_532833 [Mortierella sp. GBAus27b]|nr:hypothetical protein B0O80DRAFT_532833 [Mortierella sp. GBAus27b]
MSSSETTQTFHCLSAGSVINIPVHFVSGTETGFILWRDIQNAFENAESIRNGTDPVPFLTDANHQVIEPLRIAYHSGEELEVIVSNDNSATDIQQLIGQSRQLHSELLEHNRVQETTSFQLQLEAVNVLARIQASIQSALLPTYKLHESPIPHLFVILPKSTTNHKSAQYRLYFLCDCGAHTMPEGGRLQHWIHLAKHEGYDVELPTEFFKRYRSYLLTMMHMVKYGFRSASIVVPPLTTPKILDGLNTSLAHLLYLRNNISSLVDSTIDFLENLKRDNESEAELSTGNTGFESPENLEDLRQLKSYLRIKDRGRTLGNLYRIVTPNGHVKWVCQDHHKAYYQDSSVRQLRHTFNGAIFEEIGRIELTLYTSDKAKLFYAAMARSRVVQELKITLGWNATMDHLKALAKAVTKSNVVRLEIDGTHFTGLTLDVINRGRRFDPILQLPSNGQIQSLHLSGFHKFFTRVKDTSFVHSPMLQAFSLDSEFPFSERTRSLNNLYDNYSALKTLELRLQHQYLLTEVTGDILGKLNSLESFTIKYERLDITATVSGGDIQHVDLTLSQIEDLTSDDHEFIQRHRFSQLDAQYIESAYARNKLRGSRRTGAHGNGEHHITITATTRMELRSLIQIATSETLQDLEKVSINNGKILLTANVSQRATQDMTMDIARLGNLNPSDATFISTGHIVHLTIQFTLQEADEDRLATILQHSPKLAYLGIGCEGRRAAAVVNLVTSTREKILQEGGSSALRTFELMDEKMTPFDVHGECDNFTHIQIHVSFAENSSTFDMRTWIQLPNSTRTETHPLRGFFQQYGWSIVFLEEGPTRNDTFAAIIDDIPNTRVSQLETLSFDGSKLTASGYERLKSIIDRSPNFKELGLCMKHVDESQLRILQEYGSKLFKLHLYGTSTKHLVSKIAGLFPTRASVPYLVSFGVCVDPEFSVSSDCVRWMASMVSESTGSCKRIEKIVLRDIMLPSEDWSILVGNVDFTNLKHLELSNVPRDSIHRLAEQIPVPGLSKTPLKTLSLNNKELLHGTSPQALESMLIELQEMGMMVQYHG